MKRLRTEVEALCRAVAPELAGRPVYVALAADVYPNAGNGEGPDGCTMRHLDLMLRPTLERRGRWSGRGPAMLLDPRSIARTTESRIRPARRRVFAPTALGVAIHELAHVLTAEPDEAEPPADYVEAGRCSPLTPKARPADKRSRGGRRHADTTTETPRHTTPRPVSVARRCERFKPAWQLFLGRSASAVRRKDPQSGPPRRSRVLPDGECVSDCRGNYRGYGLALVMTSAVTRRPGTCRIALHLRAVDRCTRGR